MDNCRHQWIANSGSNDKHCVYYQWYPVLKLRYRCSHCIIESCRFCLINKEQLPPEQSTVLKIRPNRNQTLELRIITLENIIEELQKKIKMLELILDGISLTIP